MRAEDDDELGPPICAVCGNVMEGGLTYRVRIDCEAGALADISGLCGRCASPIAACLQPRWANDYLRRIR